MELEFIIGNRNRRNTAHQLIRKRPKQTLLQDKTPKRKSDSDAIARNKLSILLISLFSFYRSNPEETTGQNQYQSKSNNNCLKLP